MPPKGKGKDMSRMRAPSAPPPAASPTAAAASSAEAPPSQPASAPPPGSSPSQRVPSPGARSGKPKGKDFSRMAAPPAPVPAAVPVAQPPPPVVPSQPPAADLRRQNAARIAAGMAPLGPGGRQGSVGDNKPTPAPVVPVRQPPPQVPVQNTSYAPPQPQHQPLMPNAPPNFKPQQAVPQQPRQPPPMAPQSTVSTNAVLQPPKREVPQATPRPEWSEGRLSTMQGTPAAASGYGKASLAPILGEKLQSLCKSIDPSYSLDAEVQERLVEMADGFVDKVTKDAIKLARHRGSTTMDVVDVALALKKGYNMDVPGLGPPSVPGANKSGGQIGGWLFADKVNVGEEEPPKKKSRPDGAAATAAAM